MGGIRLPVRQWTGDCVLHRGSPSRAFCSRPSSGRPVIRPCQRCTAQSLVGACFASHAPQPIARIVTNNYAPAFIACQQYHIAPRGRRVILLRVQVMSVKPAVAILAEKDLFGLSEKSLEMRRSQVFPYPEEPELAPSWAAGVARDGKNERNGSNGGGRMYMMAARRPKRKSWIRALAYDLPGERRA
jgi:hypothetical protein